MSYRPICDFMMKMHTFKPTDVAVLFGMIALEEMAQDVGMPISPAAHIRIWGVDISPDQTKESIDRLIECGELVWVEEVLKGFGDVRGYRVTRFEELREAMAMFGSRQYQRRYQQKRRAKIRETETTA